MFYDIKIINKEQTGNSVSTYIINKIKKFTSENRVGIVRQIHPLISPIFVSAKRKNIRVSP